MLTHGNFMFELGVAVRELARAVRPRTTRTTSTLLFLPLAHVFARIIQVGCVKARVRLGHSADITNLVADLGEFRPTFVLAVPRVFEKVFNTASQRATADGRGAIFDRAAETAIAWSPRPRREGPARRSRSARRSTRSSPGSSTPGCATRWAAAAGTPCPAARRSATGSATSTAASG